MAFPFDKLSPGMLDPEMIEGTAKIVNATVKDKVKVNLIIINTRAGGNCSTDRRENRRKAP